MLFTSLEFFIFLPLVLAAFRIVPVAQRWAVLLVASYVFYGFWHPSNLVYLGAVTLVIYLCGRALARSKRASLRAAVLAGGLLVVLGSLTAFKFYDFVAGQIESANLIPHLGLPRLGVTAPAGFSFYAFSAASYLIDIYVGRLDAKQRLGGTALFVAYFPKIFAGPIERATTFLPQLWSGLRSDPQRIVLGLQLIGWGLFKKVVIADNLAPMVDHSFSIVTFAPPVELLISSYFFAFQIYCDFSGYTDIALGTSSLFGLKLMENFRRPYLSRSTAEFWGSRWHISLAHWFRDYLYIPLGGSRAGALRRAINVMIVFLVSGLWHAGLGYGVGWTFLVWGALNGAYQWAEPRDPEPLAPRGGSAATRQRQRPARRAACRHHLPPGRRRMGVLPCGFDSRRPTRVAENRVAIERTSLAAGDLSVHCRATDGLRPHRIPAWLRDYR